MLAHLLHKRRREIAADVSRKLSAAEIDTDTALSSTAQLMALLPAARKDGRLASQEVHEALVRITASWDAMVVARGEMIASHQALAVTSDRFHLSETGWGGMGEKAMSPGLVAVENAA